MPAQEAAEARSSASLGKDLTSLLTDAAELPSNELIRVVDLVGRILGAESARVLIADYALAWLQEVGNAGPTGPRLPVEGTLAGRAFARGDVVVSGTDPEVVWVPLAEGGEPLGVLELSHEAWTDEVHARLGPVVRVLVLILISKRRFTDVVARGRRAEPLSLAAEMQWELLPPLTCSTSRVSVSGILEPAYSMGGDSFDFAINPNRAEFAIIDSVGRGMSAVSISVVAIGSLRNARREGAALETAYLSTGEVIEAQFGYSYFVTAQFGSLDLDTGQLTWLNAGHPPPLLVRDGTFIGELSCRPSMPMGLRGTVEEVATEKLQPGDRVLFFTDGVIETRSADGELFGVSRLADFLVRATLDEVSTAETVRRLSISTMAHGGATLNDDASLLLIEYLG